MNKTVEVGVKVIQVCLANEFVAMSQCRKITNRHKQQTSASTAACPFRSPARQNDRESHEIDIASTTIAVGFSSQRTAINYRSDRGDVN